MRASKQRPFRVTDRVTLVRLQFINPSKLPEGKSITDHLIELTDGGLDFT